jgi:hypothetical protein
MARFVSGLKKVATKATQKISSKVCKEKNSSKMEMDKWSVEECQALQAKVADLQKQMNELDVDIELIEQEMLIKYNYESTELLPALMPEWAENDVVRCVADKTEEEMKDLWTIMNWDALQSQREIQLAETLIQSRVTYLANQRKKRSQLREEAETTACFSTKRGSVRVSL